MQNYQNHARYHAPWHFILLPFFIFNLIYHCVRLYQEPTWDRGEFILLSIAFILALFLIRINPLKAQDRIIRLEELLRYQRVLPKELADKAAGLRMGQIVALRFASDEELPDMIRRTLNGEFAKGKDIKMAIKNWRADEYRV